MLSIVLQALSDTISATAAARTAETVNGYGTSRWESPGGAAKAAQAVAH